MKGLCVYWACANRARNHAGLAMKHQVYEMVRELVGREMHISARPLIQVNALSHAAALRAAIKKFPTIRKSLAVGATQ